MDLVGLSGQGVPAAAGQGREQGSQGQQLTFAGTRAEDRPGDVRLLVSGSINRVHSSTTLQATTGPRPQDQPRHRAFVALVDYCSLPRYRDLVLRLAPSPRMY